MTDDRARRYHELLMKEDIRSNPFPTEELREPVLRKFVNHSAPAENLLGEPREDSLAYEIVRVAMRVRTA